jgi:hypothetical protein
MDMKTDGHKDRWIQMSVSKLFFSQKSVNQMSLGQIHQLNVFHQMFVDKLTFKHALAYFSIFKTG